MSVLRRRHAAELGMEPSTGAVLFYSAGAVLAVRSDKAVTLPWPELRLLAVPPDQRGQGIGEKQVMLATVSK
jgi:hypothetical protein